MTAQICKSCKHKKDRCYCAPNSTCSGYEEELLTEKEFVDEYCHNCGTQRCEGIGTEWFDGCRFKNRLKQ